MGSLNSKFNKADTFLYKFRNVKEFRDYYLGKTIDDLYEDSMYSPSANEQMIKEFRIVNYVWNWKASVRYNDDEIITEILDVQN